MRRQNDEQKRLVLFSFSLFIVYTLEFASKPQAGLGTFALNQGKTHNLQYKTEGRETRLAQGQCG